MAWDIRRLAVQHVATTVVAQGVGASQNLEIGRHP